MTTSLRLFPTSSANFATSHKGISLNVSAKCVICDRDFFKPSGAGVHIKRIHQIGKRQSYPHSPLPVMSYVDTTVNIPNTTPSTRSRRLRSISLVNSPISGVSICPPSVHLLKQRSPLVVVLDWMIPQYKPPFLPHSTSYHMQYINIIIIIKFLNGSQRKED